jgi:pyrimidine operon attenuation protein/uracil phosphoribosyltransferase
MSLPDAETLCSQLAGVLRPHVDPLRTTLVGIHTGGVWVAERLASALALKTPIGTIDVSFYRDDYSQRGLQGKSRTAQMPFEVEGAHIVLIDDVLYTGRTIRAALNEIFDYGRPARVELAVLVDRGGRELPMAATWCAHTQVLPAAQTLSLARDDSTQQLSFRLIEK